MKIESDGHFTCPICESTAIKVVQCKSGLPLILKCLSCKFEGIGSRFPIMK